MAKFKGKVVFAECVENPEGSGNWKDTLIPRVYRGDVLNSTLRWREAQEINNDAYVTQRISIISDRYAINNIPSIKYVEFLGALWCVTSVEIQRPRIILTLGGVYNGEQN